MSGEFNDCFGWIVYYPQHSREVNKKYYMTTEQIAIERNEILESIKITNPIFLNISDRAIKFYENVLYAIARDPANAKVLAETALGVKV